MDPVTRSQFHCLIEAALSGRITPHEHDQLEQALLDSPELRQEYLQAMEVHLDLSTLSHQTTPPRVGTMVQHSRRNRPVLLSAMTLAVSAVAILLLVNTLSTTTVPVQSSGDSQLSTSSEKLLAAEFPVGSPTIVEAANARIFGEWQSPTPGERIQMGKVYVLTHGYLALEFIAGAKAVMKAPCVFSAIGEAQLQIRSGQCSVHAPPGAEGFQIISPAAEVIDLGTRFVVDVADTGETELLVVDGEATMAASQKSSESPILLREGDAARVEPGLSPRYATKEESRLKFLSVLPDRVIQYQATTAEGKYADELLSVLVQRGGQNYEYDRSNLIRSRVTHFVAPQESATFCTRMGEALPEGEQRLGLLDDDWSLVTGVINPRLLDLPSKSFANDPVMTVEFAEPIINNAGPDILLFDLQLLVYPPEGDRLRIRSGDVAHTNRQELNIHQFDIDLTSPFALDLLPHRTYRSLLPTTCLDDLITNEFRHGSQVHVNAKALAVGIDLSDLGYAPGETLTRLDLLETLDRHNIDPVLIVGLPGLHSSQLTSN